MTVTGPAWRFTLYDQDDPDTPIDAIDSTMSKEDAPLLSAELFRQINSPGNGKLVLPNTATFLSGCVADRLLKCELRGAEFATLILDPPTQVLVAEKAEVEENATVGGPSTIAKLAECRVFPSNGFGTKPKQADRYLDWRAPDFDHTGWDAANEVGVYASTDLLRFPKAGWPDLDAVHISTDSYDTTDPDEPTAPSGHWPVVVPFTVSATGLFKGFVHADDWGRAYVDGVEVLTSENNGLLGSASAFQPATFDVELTAGDHLFALDVLNYWKPYATTGTPGEVADFNPSSAIFDLYELVGPEVLGALVFRSDSAAFVLDFPSPLPTFTHGDAALRMLAENQAAGYGTGIVPTFTETEDSNGTPWTVLDGLAAKVGASLLATVQGWDVDFRFRGLEWDMYVKGTLGSASGVTLHLPTDETDPATGNLKSLTTAGERKRADAALVAAPETWLLVEALTDGIHKLGDFSAGTATTDTDATAQALAELAVAQQTRVVATARQVIHSATDDSEYPVLAFQEHDTLTVQHPGLPDGEIEPQVLSIAAIYDTGRAFFDFQYELGDVVTNPPLAGSTERFALTQSRMTPGTLGGTARRAAPVAPRPPVPHTIPPRPVAFVINELTEGTGEWPVPSLGLAVKFHARTTPENGSDTVVEARYNGAQIAELTIPASAQEAEMLLDPAVQLDGGFIEFEVTTPGTDVTKVMGWLELVT